MWIELKRIQALPANFNKQRELPTFVEAVFRELGQVFVFTEIHQQIFILVVVVPVFYVFLMVLGQMETLQNNHQNTYMQVSIAGQCR